MCYDHSDWYDSITGVLEKEGYFFTPEQLNQLLSDVIKDTLNTALITHKNSDINIFEETFNKFKV